LNSEQEGQEKEAVIAEYKQIIYMAHFVHTHWAGGVWGIARELCGMGLLIEVYIFNTNESSLYAAFLIPLLPFPCVSC
jgi:hypothetical protein